MQQIKKMTRKTLSVLLLAAMALSLLLSGCGSGKESVLIYTSAEDYRVEDLTSALEERFPEYDIIVEYMSTGNQSAKLLTEGEQTSCDIIHSMDYGYLAQLDAAGILADLSSYDRSIYLEDTVTSDNYLVSERNGGAIVVNTEVLAQRGLAEPASYQDLLDPAYRGLISMPSPKSSGTGYMFLKSLVNAWGEDEAFAYFDQLTPNVLQYTTSGSGPVNALVQGEAAVGLGMIAQAVTQINQGAPLKILFFQEGAPYSLYGHAIVKGKETRPAVQEVFDYLILEYNYQNNEKFFPEQIYKDKVYTVENYPQNIQYADMSNNTITERERLLERWAY